jgi:hypothetical protein
MTVVDSFHLLLQNGYQAALSQLAIPSEPRLHLWDFEFKVFSQWGEDGILNFLCNRLDLSKPNILEIGTEDGAECNSRFLGHFRNSNAYLVDPVIPNAENLLEGGLAWRTHLFTDSIFVNQSNIQDLWTRAECALGSIDIFSLDIDGMDFWIFYKILNKLDADIIILEYNSIFGSEMSVTVPYSEAFSRTNAHFSNLYYGASLKAFINLLGQRDYVFVGSNRACTNAFFVKSGDLDCLPINIPVNLEGYTKLNIRESRNEFGYLTFLSGSDRFETIRHLPLVRVDDNGQPVL